MHKHFNMYPLKLKMDLRNLSMAKHLYFLILSSSLTLGLTSLTPMFKIFES